MRRTILIATASLLALTACPNEDDKRPSEAAEKAAPADQAPAKEGPADEARDVDNDDEPDIVRFDFDQTVPGDGPEGFQIAETNSAGKLAHWTVKADDGAPSEPHVFGISKSENEGQTYNLAIVTKPELQDLTDFEVSVMVKPGTGKIDQGGGILFRADGPHNYYVARWNPLESNVRLYVVQNSHRTALDKADVDLTDGWHHLRVAVEGNRFELFMDERSVLTVEDDTFDKGTVGLWTKTDAATWFDDLTIIPLTED